MNASVRALVFLTCVAVVAGPAAAQSQRTVSFRGGPTLLIDVPMGYSFEGRVNQDDSVRVTMLNPVWGIEIKALMARDSNPEVTSPEWQENKLIGFIGDVLSLSREGDYKFQPLNPESGAGIYCTFTASGAGVSSGAAGADGTYLTAGIKAWPGCVVIFVFTSRDLRSEEYREAFNLFRNSFTRK